MLGKAAVLKRFECSPLRIGLKKQTSVVGKQYIYLTIDDTNEFDKINKKEKPTFKKCNKSNLICNSKYSFYEYCNINPIQDGISRGCSEMRGQKGPLYKICRTYPIMMKLGTVVPYLEKTQKSYKSRDTPF